ncbi:hypothetical protein [Micromonospora chalcea]|uniref:hypothetical protein n=1 Tax=Micromonospora chalcea TaxID=1874 RepID=UPI003CEAED5C
MYSSFSTSGFSHQAQEYAIAHQICLVDLSGTAFQWLRDAAALAAQRIGALEAAVRRESGVPGGIPRKLLRSTLRRALGTANDSLPEVSKHWRAVKPDLAGVASELQRHLMTHGESEIALGFPPAPFVLTMTTRRPDTIAQFYDFASSRPRHTVGLRRHHRTNRVSHWELFPREDPDAYRLYFSLPSHIEQWIRSSDEIGARARAIKEGFLPSVLVYRVTDGSTQVFQLDYATAEFNSSP